MSEIRNFGLFRHLRAEASVHVLHYVGGRIRREGRGASFWFWPHSASVIEVPVDDREIGFLFHARSSDFQDVIAQGVITYRVVDPRALADRIDFAVDLRSGTHRKQPLESLGGMIVQLAQQLAWAYVAGSGIRTLLGVGPEQIRSLVEAGLRRDPNVTELGLEIVSVRVSGLRPSAEVEKALEIPMRERIQQDADEAGFARRALAVEKERAIAENELQNRIELSRREERLIEQDGQNAKRRAKEEAEAATITATSAAECRTLETAAEAKGLREIEAARVDAERERMAIHRDVPPAVAYGLAARELASKLESIEHLSITPELLGPLLGRLVESATARLEE